MVKGEEHLWLDYVVAVGTLLASLGALAAVGLTLYLNVWRERRRQPELTLEFSPDAEHGVIYEPDQVGGATALAPLNVRNAAGKNSAHRVEVLLSAGYWLGPPGTEGAIREFIELVNQEPITWWISDPPQGAGRATAEIPAGVSRKAVLLISGHPLTLREMVGGDPEISDQVKDSLRRKHTGIFAVVPMTERTIEWVDNQLAYEIRLTLVAEDMDAKTYRTRLRWSGVTHDELQTASGFVVLQPAWDELYRIDEDDWPGERPADNRGSIEPLD